MRINWKYSSLLPILICLSAFAPMMAQAAPFDIEKGMRSFWDTDTMYDESVQMAAIGGAAPMAKLLFPPLEILSVKSSDLDNVFVKDVDWVWENNQLKLLSGSKAAFMTEKELYPTTGGANTQPKTGGGFVYYVQGHTLHQKQLFVTYTHAPDLWKGPIPKYDESKLPNTIAKLKKGSPITIVYIGDSILLGCNTSGFSSCGEGIVVAPNMPSWGQLTADNLKRYYTSLIITKNPSIGGKETRWGRDNVGALVSAHNPDLVVIGFGMNDGGGISVAEFKSNVQLMMNNVKSKNPNAEFILVATTVANPETPFNGIQAQYKPALDQLAAPGGAVVVDMTNTHLELLKFKHFRDMTGNNINHPGDWQVRWYAQEIMGFLVPKDLKELSNRRNVALASFGGLASVSSVYDENFDASRINNGELAGYEYGAGRNGGCWNDKSVGVFPDWAQIDFSGAKEIEEIDVYTVQDNYLSPVEPTKTMAMTKNGLVDFKVQYWKGTDWETIPDGDVTGNDKIWRQFTFAPVTTTKIRVLVGNALGSYSRITEVEAYSTVPKVDIRLTKTPEIGSNGLTRIFDVQGRLMASYKGSEAPKASLLPAGSAPGLYIAVRPNREKTVFTNFAAGK